jgi:hypothetical protein
MSERHRKDSFLRAAEASDNGLFLGMNKLPTVSRTVDDEPYTIGHGYAERPDLLADVLFGNSRLWWVFALRNPDILKDPIRDFKAGVKIMVPSKQAVNIYTENR